MFVFMVSFIMALGVGGWLFFNLNSRSGEGNYKGDIAGGVIAAVIVFIILYSLLKFVLGLN